ncbi:unnamed protein product [Caenorhabditis auriculariae]|uniref:Uncharacterized protein n=1 Tax=Caenorhabditis auriculariae TaxID=2777116 RepID=A0A8S1HCQ9_9PELO|nr:unnamed protein product [Caenorhabditis auriculariae]
MAVHRKDVLKLLESLQQKEKEIEDVRSEMSVLQGRLDVCSANLATLEEEVAWVNATFEKWFQNDSLFEELLEMIKKINPEKEKKNMQAEAKKSPGETKKESPEQEAPVEAKEHEEKSPKDRKKKSVTLVEPETVQKKDGNKSKNVSVSHSRRSAYDVDSDGEFTSDDPCALCPDFRLDQVKLKMEEQVVIGESDVRTVRWQRHDESSAALQLPLELLQLRRVLVTGDSNTSFQKILLLLADLKPEMEV